MIVCPSQSNSRATSATVRPFRPTCSVTHRPARSVITRRGAAIVETFSVNVATGHASVGHAHRNLRHASRVGLPKHGKSTSSTTGRSFTRNGPSQSGQVGGGARVSTWTRNGPSSMSSTPSTVTSGNPTRSAHMRVGSSSTGASPGSGRRKTPPDSQSPCLQPRTHTPLRSEAPRCGPSPRARPRTARRGPGP